MLLPKWSQRLSELISYKSGGKIHIKKENRGKFTDYCGGKVTEECIQRGKHSSSAAIRKRATFAANARRWKHQDGGMIYTPFISYQAKLVNDREQGINSTFEQNSFPVEPVKIGNITTWFDKGFYVPEKEQENKTISGSGKIYKESEKNEFKSDLLNAYTNALKERGFDDDSAKEFSKRLVAQDALESKYGQSSLSKYFNFGGIKDFRENSDSLKTSTKEFENGIMKTKNQPFRKFKDLEEYVNYKIDLVGNENYNVFAYDPEYMYTRLTSARKKYATDPNYLKKLNNVYWLLWRN